MIELTKYSSYELTRWRRNIIRRDKGICIGCNGSFRHRLSSLQAHHLFPKENEDKEALDSLIAELGDEWLPEGFSSAAIFDSRLILPLPLLPHNGVTLCAGCHIGHTHGGDTFRDAVDINGLWRRRLPMYVAWQAQPQIRQWNAEVWRDCFKMSRRSLLK